MTMPHLENCAHSDEGWCLDCVRKMHRDFESQMEIKGSARYQHNAAELKAVAELIEFLDSWPASTRHTDLGLDGRLEVWWSDSLMGFIEGNCANGWDYHPLAFGEKGDKEDGTRDI